jgi:hypothetical protein
MMNVLWTESWGDYLEQWIVEWYNVVWFRKLSFCEIIWKSGQLSGENDDWFMELSVGENI